MENGPFSCDSFPTYVPKNEHLDKRAHRGNLAHSGPYWLGVLVQGNILICKQDSGGMSLLILNVLREDMNSQSKS